MTPLPTTIEHFTHQHPIILHDDTINPKYLCEGCMTYGFGTRYHCHACPFNLHEYCATCPKILSSFMHPDHSLMLVERDQLHERICNICRDPIEGLSYRCEPCDFNVHPICTQLPETLNHILHQAHPLKLLLGSAEPAGTCVVCRGACNASSWHYRCEQCEFNIHIDCVLVQCQKKTTDRGILTYVPPSQPYAYGIPYSHPLNMNHNYMPQPQPQHQNHEIPYWHPSTSTYFPSPVNMNHNNMPQPQPQHQNHEIPYWHPSTSTCFPSPLDMNHNNMPQPKPQPQPQTQLQHHQNPGILYWHPSTSTCFPSPVNMNHNNMPQPKPQPQSQLQHQNHGIPYWHPSPNPLPSPSNMHHSNYNMQQYPQLYQHNQDHGQVQTHNGGSGRGRRVIFNLVKSLGFGVISHVIFGVDVSPFFIS